MHFILLGSHLPEIRPGFHQTIFKLSFFQHKISYKGNPPSPLLSKILQPVIKLQAGTIAPHRGISYIFI